MPIADLPLPVLPSKPKRDDIAQDKVLCEYCSAKCCRYFALPLEEPTTREEFEYIRWFLLHEYATVFTEEATGTSAYTPSVSTSRTTNAVVSTRPAR